jgi:chromosome segregation protein
MHLKQLKLAGFKSFVDPTVVPFSSQLIAVVGPNGCGKSNIIDAVRWVMGESSAKNLRGESMADVIFNGSSQRKSVGQASVELVFDNSLGRLSGQYASYQEIAVKRLVTRDGDSFYFLNGSRCRRRDITDIFVGTGAGARSYSIIGQDTISRLIEARPEDLRAYLEEAAGVSKYKERRRETLQRINQTRENLARVADIRDELGKQIQRLERQAQAAKRYTSLKQDERLCKAEILALKWRALTSEQTQVQQQLTQLSLQQEQHRSNMTGFIKESSHLRETLHAAQETFQQVQVTFYQLKTEIARLEESVQQQQREKQRLATDKQQIETDLLTATHQLQQDNEALLSCEQERIILQTNVETLQGKLEEQQAALNANEKQKLAWDTQWQQVQTEFNQVQREAQVEQVRLQHIEQRYQQTQLRFEKIQQEQVALVVEDVQQALSLLQTQQVNLAKQQELATHDVRQIVDGGATLRQQLSATEQQLHQAQDKVRTLVTEQAALTVAQNAALRNVKKDASQLPHWEECPRLAEVLSVPEPWLRAFELVLGESLQAVVLDSINAVLPTLKDLQGHSALFVQTTSSTDNASPYPRLSDKVTGVIPCGLNTLDQIFAADSLDEALTWLPSLDKQQSVVTADGYWLGAGWVRVEGIKREDEAGLLSRQQALAKLKDALNIEQEQLSSLQITRDKLQSELTENAQEHTQLQQTLAASQDALRGCESELKNKQQLLQHALSRIAALNEEHEELQLSIEDLATQKIATEQKWQLAVQTTIKHEQQLQKLNLEKATWEEGLADLRRATDDIRKALHQAQMQSHSEALKTQQLHDNIGREQRHIDTLNERLVLLLARCHELTAPGNELSSSLNEKIIVHNQLNEELSNKQQQVDELQRRLNESERFYKEEEQRVNAAQEKLQKEQLLEQSLAVRADSMLEALTELDAQVNVLLANIADEVTLPMREEALRELAEKIKRLGAINLMAIEEYQTEFERKQHLDEQYADLTDALTTLDAAIAKMDKETQLRLKETFDQVNASFQALFPRLFGGGRAMLELTCDNLLEAGVLVMAQPPGKRNSTIHLLSGGEKAMTAVALVFAIFQLNPSPFCMLDEVDAPLDDLNVRRFCDLVKEMSQFVQFLFITHNKVTMELADHLIGVTMREPGVSRVVTVDVEAAVALAN